MTISKEEAKEIRDKVDAVSLSNAKSEALMSSAIEAIKDNTDSVNLLSSEVKQAAIINSHLDGRVKKVEEVTERFKAKENSYDQIVDYIKKTAWLVIAAVVVAVISSVIVANNSITNTTSQQVKPIK